MTTLIFGATGEVGATLARRIAARGEPVFLAGRRAEVLEALARELGAPAAICDVLDDAALEATVRAAAGAGGLAGLAFAVGSIDLAPVRRVTRELMRASFELNAASAAMALKLAEEPLKAASGAAVLFSTVAVSQGFVGHAPISAAKGAVEGIVRAFAAEWAPKVRVNAVAPSLLDTGLAQPLLSNPRMRESIARMHPLDRLGAPGDAAAAADFLLSRDAGWITGQVLAVDGGRSRVRTKG